MCRKRAGRLDEHLPVDKNSIKSHYEREIFDKIPRTEGRKDGYWSGAGGRKYLNEIEPYQIEHQKLIYNNEALTTEQIINGTVRLNDNDCITVMFS